jgi:carotenoid cleavage dioxygenase-like enzyme
VTSTAANPLADYRLGFADLEREDTVDELPLDGALPEWLSGTLLRTGPAKFAIGERVVEHWFDGLAMLHRFAVRNGRVAYANRFLRGRTYRAAAEGHIGYMEFGTDPCRSIFHAATVSIVKVDTELRRTRSWTQPGGYPGEPVFVPEPGGEEEDAGVLLSVVLDTAEGRSALVVLDARDLTELARARVPHHVPFHFHGQFFADSGRS